MYVTLRSHFERPQGTVAFLLTSRVSLRNYKLRIAVNLAERNREAELALEEKTNTLKVCLGVLPSPRLSGIPCPWL